MVSKGMPCAFRRFPSLHSRLARLKLLPPYSPRPLASWNWSGRVSRFRA